MLFTCQSQAPGHRAGAPATRKRTNQHGRVRVPTDVADHRVPAVGVPMVQAMPPLCARPERGGSRGRLDVDLGGQGGVEVPDVDVSVVAARVDVVRVGAVGRREVAAD